MAGEQRRRRSLVDDLRRRDWLRSDRVAEAFLTVPRHLFVPGRPLKDVYSDTAIVTKVVDGVPTSSSSQPAVMALMLEQLEVEPGQRVLEVGAGSGYNAALLAELAGARGRVTTIDIDPEIAAAARRHLRSAGYRRVRVIAGDGAVGHAAGAPYDRIIVTASCWQIPPVWVDQLAEGGLLVLPFRLNGAHVSLALRRRGRDLIASRAGTCGFMPLRGSFAMSFAPVAPPGLRIAADVPLSGALRRALPELLRQEREARAPFPKARDARSTALHYLVLQGKPVLLLLRHADRWGDRPFLLVVSPESAISLPWFRPRRGRLTLYGSDEAVEFLADVLARWRGEGRPDLRHLRVRVRPSRARLGALPRRVDGRYRFRRGEHLYELWFER